MKKISMWTMTGLLVTVSVMAATVVPMKLEELARRSDTIIIGKVKAVSYGMNEKTGYPETRTRFEVLNTIYGETSGGEITVALPGGPAGQGLVTVVPGMPTFKVDEKAVLFLIKDKARGTAVVTGLEQGVFRIQVDPVTKAETVYNQSKSITQLLPSGGVTGTADKSSSGVSVDEFQSEIKKAKEKAGK